MEVLKHDGGRIVGVRVSTSDCLIQQGGTANGLNTHLDGSCLFAKDTNIEIEAVELAGDSGDRLGERPVLTKCG